MNPFVYQDMIRRATPMAARAATTAAPSRQTNPYLGEAERDSMVSALARQAGGALEVTGKVLDYPGAIGRGILAGDPLSGFSWDADRRVTGQELLKQYGLLSKDANPYYSAFAGLAAEIATDPLSIISGPANALTKAGKAAKAAGILNVAQDAALARMGIEGARDTLRTGRNAYEFLGNLLPAGSKNLITKENAAVRPLVGPRVARSTTTLEETIKATRNPTTALENVKAALTKKGIDYDSVKGDKLGGALGIEYFGMIDPIILNPQSKGVQSALDLLDATGQSMRWSAPMRHASSFFDQRVGGRSSAYDQVTNLRHWDDLQAEKAAGRVAGAKHANLVAQTVLSDEAKRLLGADSLNTPQGADYLTRLFENVPTQGDTRISAAIGTNKVDEIVKSFDGIRSSIREGADNLGMVNRRMRDMYGVEWSPRVASEANFGDYGKGLSKQSYYARSLENEARQKYLMTPGGTVDLRQINNLPKVQQFLREGEKSGLSVTEVGAEIKRFFDLKHGADTPEARQFMQSIGLQYDPRVTPFKTFVPKLDANGKAIREAVLDANGNPEMVAVKTKRGKPVIDKATGQPKMEPKTKLVYADDEVLTQQQAEKIARFYMRKDASLPTDIGMFSEHPLASQVRATVAQATARANAQTVYKSLGEAAEKVGFGADSLAGTNRKPLDRALNEVASITGLKTSQKTGAATEQVKNILREQIATKHGLDPKTVNLSEWSIQEPVLNRLTAINDFYAQPRAQEQVFEIFNTIGQVFKGFLLAFPSRFTRDIYSNGFQLWLLGRNPFDVGWGLNAAAKIMAGNTDEAARLLKELPGYKLADAGSIQEKLVDDVARTGILQTLASNDLLTSNRAANLNQLIPGSTPMRGRDFAKELIPDGSRNPLQMAQDYLTIKGVRVPGLQETAPSETRNAVLNASQKANDYIDSVSRLGGMLMLMRQGVTADEAAKRVTAALVDYGSLTSFERNTMKMIFPWYSYSSRAGKYAVEQLLTQPGGAYAQTLRGFNRLQESDENTYVPEALRQQFAIRIPDSIKQGLGIGKSNTTTFLRDVDIPGHDVISLFSPGPGIYPTVRSTAANLAQQSNPLIQSAVELITGTDMFSRRPLEQADTSLDRIYKAAYQGMTGNRPATGIDPLLRQLIELTPAPRISGIVGGLVDPRIPMEQRIAKQLVNTLTGVKLQDVDPAYQLSDARRILSQELGSYMRDYSESYIPKDVLPQVPPELLPKYQLFRTLGRDLREQRKTKQEAAQR
jgi:hypothetical protein